MNHHLKIDGQSFQLTTDHAASSYGQPVLVGGEPAGVFGPGDTGNLNIEEASEEAISALRAAGFTFTLIDG